MTDADLREAVARALCDRWMKLPERLRGVYRARADAAIALVVDRCAKVCETAEIPFDVDVWLRATKKEMTAKTALALADLIRALAPQEPSHER